MQQSPNEIASLIYLLDDPEPYVRSSVMNRFEEIGESAVPQLDQVKSRTKDPDLKEALSEAIQRITFDSFQQDVVTLAEDGIFSLEDLEDAVFTFSRFDNPTIRTRPFVQMLDQLADEAAPYIHKAESERKKMQALIGHLYTRQGFDGCQGDYLNPRNTYLHHVLNTRTGIPLSLAFIILFTGRRLQLPFHGVNMPLHFLVKFVTVNNEHLLIDPFNNGAVLSREQCNQFLRKSGIKVYDQYYESASPYSMFTRFLRNLINGHNELNENIKAERLGKLLSLLESTRVQ